MVCSVLCFLYCPMGKCYFVTTICFTSVSLRYIVVQKLYISEPVGVWDWEPQVTSRINLHIDVVFSWDRKCLSQTEILMWVVFELHYVKCMFPCFRIWTYMRLKVDLCCPKFIYYIITSNYIFMKFYYGVPPPHLTTFSLPLSLNLDDGTIHLLHYTYTHHYKPGRSEDYVFWFLIS